MTVVSFSPLIKSTTCCPVNTLLPLVLELISSAYFFATAS